MEVCLLIDGSLEEVLVLHFLFSCRAVPYSLEEPILMIQKLLELGVEQVSILLHKLHELSVCQCSQVLATQFL